MAVSPINNLATQGAQIGGNAIAPPKATHPWASTILRTSFEALKAKTQRAYQILHDHPLIYVGVIATIALYLLYRRVTKVSPTAPIIQNPPTADIVARVRIPAGHIGGPIRGDHKYNFKGRLCYEDKTPYQYDPKDHYLALEAQQPVDLKGLDTDAQGVPGTFIYLPASLFAGRNNGDIVRFIWDGKTVELKCTAPRGQLFSQNFSVIQTLAKKKPSLWAVDVPNQVTYKGIPVGETILIDAGRLFDEKDLSRYEDDEKLRSYTRCPYPLAPTSEGMRFDPALTKLVALNEIELAVCTDLAGNTTLIVVAPHKKEAMNNPFYYHGWYTILPELPPLKVHPHMIIRDDCYHLIYKND